MSTMYDIIERAVNKTIAVMLNGDGVLVGGMAKELTDAIMAEGLLSDEVLVGLADRFSRRLKTDLRTLCAHLDDAANRTPPRAMPDAIAEWTEELARIGMAVYHFVEEEDVLEALRFIDMSGSDWSDYIYEAEAADGD